LDIREEADAPLPRPLGEVFRLEEEEIRARLERLPLCNASQELLKNYAIGAVQAVIDKSISAISLKEFQKLVNAATVAVGNLAQQIQIQRPIRERGDTYVNYNAEMRELSHSLQPGWVGIGSRHDVPKNACYVAHHGHTYVWVTPDQLEQFTNLTIAIVDVGTAYTSATTLVANPFSGAPVSPTTPVAPAGAQTPKYSAPGGEEVPSGTVPLWPLPAARGRVSQAPPPGPNVVPAPPTFSGILR
jgi:hypothetical protein